MPKKNQTQYDQELLDTNVGVVCLELYAGAHTKILHRCVCGKEWSVKPSDVLYGIRCGCRDGQAQRQAQYDQELLDKNLGVARLESYVDARTKILHLCVCGNSWLVRPETARNGHRCGCLYGLAQRKSQEQYDQELLDKNLGVVRLEPYAGSHTKILHRCVCGKEWSVAPDGILSQGSRCGCRVGLARLKSHDQFVEELADKNPHIRVAANSRYVGISAKMTFSCLRNTEHRLWEAAPNNALHQGNGCPACGRESSGLSRRLTTKEVERRHPDMVSGQQWRGTAAEYWYVCEKHGKYSQTFDNHKGCPACRNESASEARSLGIEEAEKEYPDMVRGQTWENVDSKYWFICKKHGKYMQIYKNRRRGNRCPRCSESRGELAVHKWISVNIERNRFEQEPRFERQKKFEDCRSVRSLPFDFGSEALRILIEYHGRQHYRPVEWFGGMKVFKELQRRDQIKRDWAQRNLYRLIVVPYTVKGIDQYLKRRLGHLS